jgi:hypothetical protein
VLGRQLARAGSASTPTADGSDQRAGTATAPQLVDNDGALGAHGQPARQQLPGLAEARKHTRRNRIARWATASTTATGARRIWQSTGRAVQRRELPAWRDCASNNPARAGISVTTAGSFPPAHRDNRCGSTLASPAPATRDRPGGCSTPTIRGRSADRRGRDPLPAPRQRRVWAATAAPAPAQLPRVAAAGQHNGRDGRRSSATTDAPPSTTRRRPIGRGAHRAGPVACAPALPTGPVGKQAPRVSEVSRGRTWGDGLRPREPRPEPARVRRAGGQAGRRALPEWPWRWATRRAVRRRWTRSRGRALRRASRPVQLQRCHVIPGDARLREAGHYAVHGP